MLSVRRRVREYSSGSPGLEADTEKVRKEQCRLIRQKRTVEKSKGPSVLWREPWSPERKRNKKK
jgi:hypothetical protein